MFFFSSRRRHTRLQGDWSSDVCSSDLVFHENDLTREHIVPISAGGGHQWMNLVTACRSCNHRKGARTPEQARMPLLYTPYIPSLWEDFILRNRRILADQMELDRKSTRLNSSHLVISYAV